MSDRSGLPWLLARVVAAAALLGILLHKLDVARVLALFVRLPLLDWAAAVALVLAGVYISCLKLSAMLGALNIMVPFWPLFRVYLIGIFWGNFIPGTVGGDFIKYAYIARSGGARVDAASAIFAERLSGVLALLAIALAGGLCYHGLFDDPLILAVIALLTVGAFAFLIALRRLPLARLAAARHEHRWTRRILELLHKAHCAGLTMGRDRRVLSIAAVTSLAFSMDCVLVTAVFIAGLGRDVPFGQLTLLVTLVQLVTMLPISINGIGIREWAYVYLLGKCGIAAETAMAVSLMVYLSVLLVSLIGGVLFVTARATPRKTDPHTPGA